MKMNEASLRRNVFLGAVALAAGITLIFGINALSEELLELGIIDLLVSVISLAILWAARKRRDSIVVNWIFVGVMASFFIYLFGSGGHGGTGLLFMLLIPLSTPLFLGWRHGVVVSVACMLVCVGLVIRGNISSPLPGIPEGALLARAGAIYAASLILSTLYDSGMQRAYREETRAKEALRQSEERYRTILDETGDGYFELDLAGNLTFGNDAMMRLLGCSGEEAIGMNYRAFAPAEEETKAVVEAYNRMYKTGEPLLDYPSHIIRKDGTHGFAETSSFPIRNEKGDIVGFRGVRRDITERKRAEEGLELQMAYFQQLFDGSPDAIVMLDTDDRVIQANRGFEVLFGYAAEEITGRPINDLVTLEDSERESSALSRAVLRGRVVRKEVMRRRKDGRPVHVSVVGYPIRAKDELVGIYVIYTDITERKLSEEKLRESNARFDQLAEQSLTWVWEVDAQGRYTYASHVVEQVIGYRPQELVGRMHFYDLHPEEGRETFKSGAFEVFARREPIVDLVNAIQIKNGDTIWVCTNGIPVLNCDGSLRGYRGSDADITRRKKAEDALKRSEERYRTILEEMEDSYFEVDLGGHLTFVNSSVCRDLGHSREELMGMSYKQFIAEEDVESVFRVFNEVYLTGMPNKGFPWKTIRKDGSYGFAETSVSPLRNDEGGIIGFRGVGRDVTERRKMQEQLMLTDRLASIGQLTSGIAHELNNPLTGVIGFSDLLLRRDLPAEVKEDLETVNREARRTSTVVKGLLAFARQQGSEKTPVSISGIIEEVLLLRSYEQRVNNIEVETRFATDMPQVLGNGAQLQQVFMNIIINAEQAMLEARGRGRLTIATEQVGDVVRASVADDGPGIGPGDMKRIFTPFFTTKEVGKGTGLGLSICHGIITEHGGSIYAESEPGEGATFVVELPISNRSSGGDV